MSKAIFPDELLQQDIAILGRKGSGKTYAAKGMVETLLAHKRRICIIDPMGVWYGLRSTIDGKRAGFPIIVFGGQHADVEINEHSGEALARALADKNLPAIVDLSEMLIGQRHRFMTDFAEALYRWNKLPLHLVIDEADEFAPQQPLPETRRMLHQIDRIVRRGRVRGFRVMLITQRPAVLHKNVLSQANTLIAMRLTAPQDRMAVNVWVEGQADKAQAKGVLDTLAGLQRGEGWVWAPELNLLQRTKFPPITTFDSSRTPEDDETVVVPTRLAEVDLTEITASFEAVKREARTVEELRAELAKLRKQAPKSSIAATTPGVPIDEVRQRIGEAVAKALEAAPDPMVFQATREALHEAKRWAEQIIAAVDKAHGAAAGRSSPAYREAMRPAAVREAVSKVALPAPAKPVKQGAAAPGPGMSGPEQRIIDAIAWLESIGVEAPEQPAVAFLAGYSYGGGAFNNPRGRLNQRGLVEYRPEACIALTDAGRAVANAPPKVVSNGDLHARVLLRLDGPCTRLLEPLLAAYPRAMSNAELAAAAGYTAGAGSFNNPRGRLRSLGLVEYPQPGHVVARALLFPKGAD